MTTSLPEPVTVFFRSRLLAQKTCESLDDDQHDQNICVFRDMILHKLHSARPYATEFAAVSVSVDF